LMAATGLRPGEVYRLGRDHVDLDTRRLAVMHSKQGKSRQIPLHPTTVDSLGRYARLRDRSLTHASGTGFFLTASGSNLTSEVVTGCFRRLVRSSGINPGGARSAARLGDLRHSFAVHTLLSWHDSGVDVQRQLPVLSAFLGHNEPAHTYWYLQAVPELMALAADRLEGVWQVRP
jgi:integrase/recombinase XerD